MEKSIKEALLALTSANFEACPHPRVADWSALLKAAQAHGLVPMAYALIEDCAWPTEVKSLFRCHALAMAHRTVQLEGELGIILAALEDSGISAIVLKGPALANTVYPDPSLRPYGDLDLWCREDDWVVAHQVLVRLGFKPLRELPKPPPRAWPRKAFCHSQYYRQEGNILLEVHYDLWQNGLRPRLGALYWERAVPLRMAGVSTRMLAVEDQILHLCVHLHHHGYSRLIWFVDLALLVRTSKRIDWHYLVAAAKQEAVDLSVYYGLYYLQCLLQVAAPAWTLQALRPSPFRSWLHDRLWPPSTVLGLDTPEQVRFELREVPRAGELLLNLMLTGRCWEKAAYLGRLLAPPSDWLSYYYDTGDPAVLRRRRVVHAPKLLASMIRELGQDVSACLCRNVRPRKDERK